MLSESRAYGTSTLDGNIPALFIILTILSFNILERDALREMLDPKLKL